jgi:predicted dienelactone hydrolase
LKVDVKLDEWTDAARDGRVVPVKLYVPQWPADAKPAPVIILSHGLGGSREGLTYAAKAWAEHGYFCVTLQHPGSDESVWRQAKGAPMAALRAAASPQQLVARVKDVSFALDQLAKLNESDPQLKGKLDLDRVGVAGHSFGAHTVMACAGERYVGGMSLREPRVKAAIAFSPAPPSASNLANLDAAYADVRVPIFHFTGTRDASPIGDTRPPDRRVPFDHIRGADEYLVIFDGADHMVFNGPRGGRLGGALGFGERPADFDLDRTYREIEQLSTAFWDAYLRGDQAAKAWLSDERAKAVVGAASTFEMKRP